MYGWSDVLNVEYFHVVLNVLFNKNKIKMFGATSGQFWNLLVEKKNQKCCHLLHKIMKCTYRSTFINKHVLKYKKLALLTLLADCMQSLKNKLIAYSKNNEANQK